MNLAPGSRATIGRKLRELLSKEAIVYDQYQRNHLQEGQVDILPEERGEGGILAEELREKQIGKKRGAKFPMACRKINLFLQWNVVTLYLLRLRF